MRRVLLGMLALVLMGAGGPAPARASAYDPATILSTMPLASVTNGRLMCATGVRGRMVAALQKGFGSAPIAIADECLAYLLRFARLGQFGAPVTMRGNPAPMTLALDSAFMTAYSRREAVASGIPALASLRPVAERCFLTTEPDAQLCSAVGYAIGVRLANGEPLVGR